MDRYENLLSVGRKKGEWDFSVRATITELTIEEMNEFRSMLIVAIGIAEDMYRRARQDKSEQSKSEKTIK